ncbi:MAG: hypothetical protein FWG11_05565 [Promicromonosporaceae bacterium]|nr:hypothetical protein [Promicromonosporaceae bacterium]
MGEGGDGQAKTPPWAEGKGGVPAQTTIGPPPFRAPAPTPPHGGCRGPPTPAAGAGPDPRREDSYQASREIEALVRQFRAEVVAEVRQADLAGAVTKLSVETTRTVLEGARHAISATVRAVNDYAMSTYSGSKPSH